MIFTTTLDELMKEIEGSESIFPYTFISANQKAQALLSALPKKPPTSWEIKPESSYTKELEAKVKELEEQLRIEKGKTEGWEATYTDMKERLMAYEAREIAGQQLKSLPVRVYCSTCNNEQIIDPIPKQKLLDAIERIKMNPNIGCEAIYWLDEVKKFITEYEGD